MKPTRIPRRIDEPPHLLMWPLDEVLPIFVGIAIGLFIGSMFYTLIIGFIIAKLYKAKKDKTPDGFFFHFFFWWTSVGSGKAKTMINPFIRRLFP